MTIPYTDLDGLYIGSRWGRPDGGRREAVLNPANEEVIGQAPVGGVAEAEAAIDAARRAFDGGQWAGLPQARRTEIMRRMHKALWARADRIKALMIAEGGVTVGLTQSMPFGPPLDIIETLLDRSLIPTERHLP